MFDILKVQFIWSCIGISRSYFGIIQFYQPIYFLRKLSEIVLNAIADGLPELVGGSADLTHSNLTRWKTAVDFQHESTGLGNYAGRYLRFGVREHGMAAICNGIAAFGGLIPFGATFLNFLG
jgi:transketolase